MKAISLWEPWATLWLLSDPDEKIFETRSWATSHRGPLAVHAAMKRDGEVREAMGSQAVVQALARHGMLPGDLKFGAVIGCVEVVGCTRTEDLVGRILERERVFGDWRPQRFAWSRAPKPMILEDPIPFRGMQRIFEVPDSLFPGI